MEFWEIDFEAIHGGQPEQDVSSLWGCRSLLQSGVKYDGVKKSDHRRSKADTYDTPAIFDYSNPEHKGPIWQMAEHMARYEPRGF